MSSKLVGKGTNRKMEEQLKIPGHVIDEGKAGE